MEMRLGSGSGSPKHSEVCIFLFHASSACLEANYRSFVSYLEEVFISPVSTRAQWLTIITS